MIDEFFIYDNKLADAKRFHFSNPSPTFFALNKLSQSQQLSLFTLFLQKYQNCLENA